MIREKNWEGVEKEVKRIERDSSKRLEKVLNKIGRDYIEQEKEKLEITVERN